MIVQQILVLFALVRIQGGQLQNLTKEQKMPRSGEAFV